MVTSRLHDSPRGPDHSGVIRNSMLLLVSVVAAACAGPATPTTAPAASTQPTPTLPSNPATTTPATAEPSPIDTPTDRPTERPATTPEATVQPTPEQPSEEPTEPFVLTSSAFEEGQPFPPRFTCDGADDQLPLAWTGVPPGTVEFALIQHDPDAGGFVHWVVVGIPADATSLGEPLPDGASHGTNDFGRALYNGPCPPSGNHTYVTTLFALSAPLELGEAPSARQVRQRAKDLTLGTAQLRGAYSRAR
jgi:Raf kinase inhibitor-like YbhB/YbcL family protein